MNNGYRTGKFFNLIIQRKSRPLCIVDLCFSFRMILFPVMILSFSCCLLSCFDGLGPITEEKMPDYSGYYAKSLYLSVDHDITEDNVSFSLKIIVADDENLVGNYALYWGDASGNILGGYETPVETYAPEGSDINDTIASVIPAGAEYLLLYTKLTVNNLSVQTGSGKIDDLVMQRLTDINPSGDSSISNPVIFNDKLYFSAYDGGTYGQEMWCYDDTSGLSGPVTDINPSASSSVDNLAVFNNRIYFSAYHSATGYELYYYDGNNTFPVDDYITGTASLYPNDLIVSDNRLFFTGSIGIGSQLLCIDTSHNFTEILVNPSANATPSNLYSFNNTLFFNANASTTGGIERRLYKYDGVLSEISIDGYTNPNPLGFISYNDMLYFGARIPAYGDELWRYNGVSAELASDIKPGTDSSLAGGLFVYNDRLYFSADDGNGDGRELWYYSQQGMGHFNLVSGSAGSYPYNEKCEFNGYMFFTAYTVSTNFELWVYRSTGIPELIADLNPGTSSCDIEGFTVYNNRLYFIADDGVYGKELWVLYFK